MPRFDLDRIRPTGYSLFALDGEGGRVNLSPLIKRLSWSSSLEEAAVRLDVELAAYPGLAGMVDCGHQLVLYGPRLEDGKDFEILRGYVFDRELTAGPDGGMKLTAYDLMVYLLKNRDDFVYRKAKASQIIAEVCQTFGIPTGEIADTGHYIDKLIGRNISLYDLFVKALVITRNNTGKKYYLRVQQGKLALVKKADDPEMWVLDSGANLQAATVTESIQDLKNRVVVRSHAADDERSMVLAVEEDKEMTKLYGLLQEVQTADGDAVDKAKAKTIAQQVLKKLGKVSRTASVTAIGVTTLAPGDSVLVSEAATGLQGAYFAKDVAVTVDGSNVSMDLTLSWDDDYYKDQDEEEARGGPSQPTAADYKAQLVAAEGDRLQAWASDNPDAAKEAAAKTATIQAQAAAQGVAVSEPSAADLQGARQGALATVEQRIDEAMASGNFQLAAELAQKRAAAAGGGAASTGAGRPPTEAEVRQIQAYFGITEAGFGPATKAKVAELQEPFGMAADSHGWLGAKPVDTLLAGHRYQTSLHTWVDQVASTYRDDRTELNAAAGALAREDQAQIVTYTYRKAPVAASIARVEKEKWTQAEAGDPLPLIQAGNALTELPKQVGVDPQVQTEINRLKSGGDQQGREWLKQQIIERKIAYWRIRAEQGLEPAEAWDAVHYEPLRCLKNRPENQQLFTAETLQYFEAQFTWAASVHEQLGHLEAAKKEYWAAYLSGGSTKAARDKAAAARRALLDLKIVGSAGRPLWDDQDPNAVVWLIDTTKRTNLDAFVQACREQFWEKVSERVVPTPRSDLAARYQISLQSESAVAQAQQYLPALQREYRQAQLYAGSGEPLLSEPAVWNLAFLRQYLKEYTDQWDVDSGLSQAILQAVKEYLQITPAIPYELGGDGNKLSAAQYAALAAEGKPLPGIDCSGYVMQVMKRVSSLIGWTDPESAIWANSGTYLDQKEIAGCPPMHILEALPGDLICYSGVHIMIFTYRTESGGQLTFGITDSSDAGGRGPKDGTLTVPMDATGLSDPRVQLTLPGYGGDFFKRYPQYKVYRPTYWLQGPQGGGSSGGTDTGTGGQTAGLSNGEMRALIAVAPHESSSAGYSMVHGPVKKADGTWDNSLLNMGLLSFNWPGGAGVSLLQRGLSEAVSDLRAVWRSEVDLDDFIAQMKSNGDDAQAWWKAKGLSGGHEVRDDLVTSLSAWLISSKMKQIQLELATHGFVKLVEPVATTLGMTSERGFAFLLDVTVQAPAWCSSGWFVDQVNVGIKGLDKDEKEIFRPGYPGGLEAFVALNDPERVRWLYDHGAAWFRKYSRREEFLPGGSSSLSWSRTWR